MANGVPAAEDIGKAAGSVTSARKLAGYLLAIVVPVALWIAPLRLDAKATHTLAVASFTIVTRISEILPLAIAGLFVLFILDLQDCAAGICIHRFQYLFPIRCDYRRR